MFSGDTSNNVLNQAFSQPSMSAFGGRTSAGLNNNTYTDLNQLKNINVLAKQDQNAAFKKMAQQFEGIFLQLMLKTMRQASSAFAGEQSSEMDMHQSMFDNQLALNLSGDRGIGIADSFYNQMLAQYSAAPPTSQFENAPFPSKLLAKTFDGNIKSLSDPLPIKNSDVNLGTAKTNDSNFLPASPTEFVNAIKVEAERVAERLGIEPEILIAQSALETGWGKYVISDSIGRSSNNLFNIKADSRWDGGRVGVTTLEYSDGIPQKENANFRRYQNVSDSFTDYAQFIMSEPRYQNAHQSDNGRDYIIELQQSGYATDPNYAKKVIELLDHDAIKNYAAHKSLATLQVLPQG